MILEGTIFDATSGQVIPGVTVSAVNAFGDRLDEHTITDNTGSFRLQGYNINKPNGVVFSHVSFVPSAYNFSGYDEQIEVELQRDVETLDPVTVHGTIPKSTAMLGLLGLLALASTQKNRRSVNGLDVGPARASGNTETFLLVAMGAAAIFGFSYIKKFLEGLGFWKSPEEKGAEDDAQNPKSPWSPAFYKAAPAGSIILTTATADKMIKDLKDCFGYFGDDEEAAIGIFKQLKTQAQLSFLAERFYQTEGSDLITWLYADGWPNDRLSASELATIRNYINALPKYR